MYDLGGVVFTEVSFDRFRLGNYSVEQLPART